jgi:hypothetical protein
MDLLLGESIREVLDHHYEKALTGRADHHFGVLVDLCQRNPDGIEGELRGLIDMVRTTEEPRRTLDVIARRLSMPYRKHFRKLVHEDLDYIRRTATELFQSLERQLRRTPTAEKLHAQALRLSQLPSPGRSFRDLWSLRETFLASGTVAVEDSQWKHILPQAKKLSPAAHAAFNNLKTALQETVISRLPETPEKLIDQERELAKYGRLLSDLLNEVVENYEKRKALRGWLDFADLELRTLRFLEAELASGYDPSRRYDHTLVDEFQDINRLQARIIDLLTRGRRRFLVGDLKQCIYQFRLSAPDIFRDLLRDHHTVKDPADYLSGDQTVSSGRGLAVQVRDSFRSRRPILSLVNRIFSQLSTLPGGIPGDVLLGPGTRARSRLQHAGLRSVSRPAGRGSHCPSGTDGGGIATERGSRIASRRSSPQEPGRA